MTVKDASIDLYICTLIKEETTEVVRCKSRNLPETTFSDVNGTQRYIAI